MSPDRSTSIDTPAIRFSAVAKRIDERSVLHDLRFDVRAGETLAIVGVNGAGKTTLLRCLLDYLKVSAGSIEIFGVPSTDPQSRARLVFLPERFVPPGHLSGHETLVWLAGLRGNTWSLAQSKDGLSRFGIDPEALHRPLRHFSKGMTQKIGLMACLLSKAPLIVLDEPMSGLDPQARRAVGDALLDAKGQGRTIVLTSHSMGDVERLCDRLALIHRNTLQFLGTPQQLRERHGSGDLETAFLNCLEAKEAPCLLN